MAPAGSLVVVATPIGNLGDLSPRAARALAVADLVACEDTRRTGKLLEHAGVRARRLLRLDAHREAAGLEAVVEVLEQGGRVALVTDAGTPGVSDPGGRTVAAVAAAGFEVRSVPGPSAALAALVVSGLPTDRFVVEGFLPRKGRERHQRLAEVAAETRTTVLFESPHRVAATLGDLAERCGADRPVAICRELTKLHETTWRGPLGRAADAVANPRGEYVVVIGGRPAVEVDDEVLRRALDAALEAGASRRDAARAVAEDHGVAPNRVKRLLDPG